MNDAQRTERFEAIRAELEQEGWHGISCTISVLKANLMAFVTAGPIAAVCAVVFILTKSGVSGGFGIRELLIFYALLLASIFVHEGLHDLAWSLFCKHGWKSIHLGVMWKKLTPYCCCMEPLAFGPYLVGGLAPLVVLGFGLFAAAMLTGSVLLLLLSLVNILAAGGDTTIALMLLRHRKARIMDHPTACGFWAFYPKESGEQVDGI